ncbi:MAG: hypothetical protein VX951_03755, partial [Planctomycetota bacterium]|nr:hypothetical protein [Planctomycetota bacterium]
KTSKNRFAVEVPEATDQLTVSYSVYCHEFSVRTSDLTDRHAFLTGAELFLWPVGMGNAPVEVRVRVPDSWDLQTSLPTERCGAGEYSLKAEGLDDLIDSPILAGQLDSVQFSALARPHSFVLDGLDGIPVPDCMVADTVSIIEHAAQIFGGSLPYQEYKFLCMFTDSGRGGLEHLSSSALLAPRTTFRPRKHYQEFMGLVAHEFFHVWNVKRMRPAELWKFDYEHENYTSLLWVAEGFTAYYDDHLCRRAGILTSKDYLAIVAKGITDLRRSPGRMHQSLSEASYDAWIRLYRPEEHTRNSTLSYYGNGALVAMCLDLRIRAETKGEKSLDDAMRHLYEHTFENGQGYSEESVCQSLSHAAGCDLAEMLACLVHQPLDPDFAGMFTAFGLELDESSSDAPYLGVHFKAGTTTIGSVIEDSPADCGHLLPGDEILAVAGLRVTARLWSDVFDHVASCGEQVEFLLSRRGSIVQQALTPAPQPHGKCHLVPAKDATAQQLELRRGWLFETADE